MKVFLGDPEYYGDGKFVSMVTFAMNSLGLYDEAIRLLMARSGRYSFPNNKTGSFTGVSEIMPAYSTVRRRRSGWPE